MLKQLSDQDASFLYVETPETPANVGSLSLVDLPEGYRGDFFADYRAHVASRMMHVPFMHVKLATLPLDLDRPFWVEDPDIDLGYHVRHATVPRPGTWSELEALVAQLHATSLDRTRPLWQFYLIDGLASGQVAIYAKIHHTAMDGASSQALIATMYDPSSTPRVLAPPEPDRGAQRGSVANLMRSLLAHRVQQVIRAAHFVPQALGVVARLALPDPTTLRYRRIAPWPRSPTTLLNVGITNQRAYAARTLSLATVKQIARQTGTKINDVVMAVCSGALRGYLIDHGTLPMKSLTAMIPVAMRDPMDPTSPNHNGLFLCNLASDVADPYERLLTIHRSSTEQKQTFDLFKDLPVPDVTLLGVSAIVRRLVALYGRSRFVGRPPLIGNLCISNVPGPTAPLYIAGARLLSLHPCSIPFHGQALNITVESYCDGLDVGLIACRRAVPDVGKLADRMVTALAALQQAVARSCPAPRVAVIVEDRTGRVERPAATDAGRIASLVRPPGAALVGPTASARAGARP